MKLSDILGEGFQICLVQRVKHEPQDDGTPIEDSYRIYYEAYDPHPQAEFVLDGSIHITRELFELLDLEGCTID